MGGMHSYICRSTSRTTLIALRERCRTTILKHYSSFYSVLRYSFQSDRFAAAAAAAHFNLLLLFVLFNNDRSGSGTLDFGWYGFVFDTTERSSNVKLFAAKQIVLHCTEWTQRLCELFQMKICMMIAGNENEETESERKTKTIQPDRAYLQEHANNVTGSLLADCTTMICIWHYVCVRLRMRNISAYHSTPSPKYTFD